MIFSAIFYQFWFFLFSHVGKKICWWSNKRWFYYVSQCQSNL